MKRIVGNDMARFASKMVLVGDCWLWTGRVSADGYGLVDIARKGRQAHRAVYQLLVGPIPPGLELDHLCRQRDCVAPTHLEPISHAENVARSPVALATINARKAHCKQGHPFDDANTYIYPQSGRRACRACVRRWQSESKQRRYDWD